MLVLASATSLLTLTVSAAVTVHVHISYMDLTGSTAGAQVVNPGEQNTIIVGPGSATILSAPAAGTRRNAKFLSARDTHAATSTDLLLEHTDGSTEVEVKEVTLGPKGEMQFVDGMGFTVL